MSMISCPRCKKENVFLDPHPNISMQEWVKYDWEGPNPTKVAWISEPRRLLNMTVDHHYELSMTCVLCKKVFLFRFHNWIMLDIVALQE